MKHTRAINSERLTTLGLNTIETITVIPLNPQQFLIANNGKVIGYYNRQTESLIILSNTLLGIVAACVSDLQLINCQVQETQLVKELDFLLVNLNKN